MTGPITTVNPAALPGAVHTLVYLFERSHELWRGWRKTEDITRNAASFIAYAGGSGADFLLRKLPGYEAVRETYLVQPARWIQQARCLLAATNQIRELMERCDEWRDALKVQEIDRPPRRFRLNMPCLQKLVVPSKLLSAEHKVNSLLAKVDRAVKCLFAVLLEAWRVSMRIMDVKESFSTDAKIGDEAIRALISNLLESNRLLEELNKNEESVDWILDAYLSDILNAPAEGALQFVRSMRRNHRRVYGFIGNLVFLCHSVETACKRQLELLKREFTVLNEPSPVSYSGRNSTMPVSRS